MSGSRYSQDSIGLRGGYRKLRKYRYCPLIITIYVILYLAHKIIMIIYEEEYNVPRPKIPEWEKNHLIFDKIIKSLDAPFLKGWYVWQERFDIGKIRCVWIVDELADLDRLWTLCFNHPEWSAMVPKIMETMVEGTYKYSLWKPISNEEIESRL